MNPNKLLLSILLTSTLPLNNYALAQDQGSSFSIEEIVVTARKRAESLQETPISIAAFSGNNLEERQIDNVSQIATFTPNLIFDTSSAISGSKSSASVFIRGVGQTDFVLSTDPGVGLYLDGVYISRSIGSVLDIVDVERVEVLRGPQGTLFGRNTIGGAISVTSKKPSEEFGGSASITAGSFDRFHVKANLNIPINENLLSSYSIARFDREGHIDRPNLGDTTGGDDSWSGRASFLWAPKENIEVNLNIDGTTVRESSCCNELVGVNENGFFALANNGFIFGPVPLDRSDPGFFDASDLPTKEFQDNTDQEIPSELDIFGVSLAIETELANGLTFKSITAYRDLESVHGRDLTHSTNIQFGATIDVFNHQQFSEELQLQGAALNNRLQWITGLYYFEEKGLNIDDVNFDPVVHLISGGQVENDSIAAFAQATYDLNDKLSVTGGLRWTRDTKRFMPMGFQFVINSSIGLPPGALLVPDDEREVVSTEVLPMLNIAYQWTDDLMVYATYSEGFKGGGFTQRVFPPLPELPSFRPEFVEVVELGFKSTVWNSRLRINGAVFTTNYDDLQVLVQDVIAPITENAAKARIQGLELEMQALLAENFTVEVGIGYLDADYLEIDPRAVATGLTLEHDLVNTPEWSLNASASYSVDFMGLGSLTSRIDWSYKDDYANDAFNEPLLNQESYSLLNASFAFISNDELWSLVLSGKNLSDERYKIAGFADLITQSSAEASFGRPSEWALTVKRKF